MSLCRCRISRPGNQQVWETGKDPLKGGQVSPARRAANPLGAGAFLPPPQKKVTSRRGQQSNNAPHTTKLENTSYWSAYSENGQSTRKPRDAIPLFWTRPRAPGPLPLLRSGHICSERGHFAVPCRGAECTACSITNSGYILTQKCPPGWIVLNKSQLVAFWFPFLQSCPTTLALPPGAS